MESSCFYNGSSTRLSRRPCVAFSRRSQFACEGLNRLALLAKKVVVWPDIPISEAIASYKIQEQYSKESS